MNEQSHCSTPLLIGVKPFSVIMGLPSGTNTLFGPRACNRVFDRIECGDVPVEISIPTRPSWHMPPGKQSSEGHESAKGSGIDEDAEELIAYWSERPEQWHALSATGRAMLSLGMFAMPGRVTRRSAG
jgi:hypothetical protein